MKPFLAANLGRVRRGGSGCITVLFSADEAPPVPKEQYQERFWRRRLDGIGLDTATKEFLAIEFKRT